MKQVEVLAPAGSMEAFKAALSYGAQAIYLGEKKFSARAHAQNFSLEEVQEAVRLAHLQGTKVHVTLNTLLADQELMEAVETAKKLAKIGVDALIVQDLGLIRMLRSVLPYMDLHGSTQMTIHNVQGAKLCKDLGLTRVVLSRETPFEEIKRIKDIVDIEVEVFVHGALCVCYSGQCTMSSYIGGRSGNRGDCAQPCRKQYQIIRGKELLKSGYLLSPKDLWTLDQIPDLIDLGVDSFKIEGRMKKPSYVAYVTEMISKACQGQRDRDLELRARETFNRGFTRGRTFGAFGQDFITQGHGKNKGIYLGQVDAKDPSLVQLQEGLREGDGISYLDQEGFLRGFEVAQDLPPGQSHLTFPYPAKKGSDIYRTFNSHLANFQLRDLEKTGLRGRLSLKKGQPVSLDLDKPIKVSIQGALVEEAQKRGLDQDRVRSQMDKLGDTPFYWEDLDLDLDPNCFLSIKDLNALRRDLVEEIFQSYQGGEDRFGKLPPLRMEGPVEGKRTLYIENQEIARGLKRQDLEAMDRIMTRDLDLIENLQGLGREVYYVLPPIVDYDLGQEEKQRALDLYRQGKIVGVEATSLWPFAYQRDLSPMKIHAGMGTGAFNSQSISMLRDLGASSIDISYEATYKQAQVMARNCGGDLSTLYYGFLTGMIMDHCPNSLVKGCKDSSQCETCSLNGVFALRDEKNMDFPFRRQGKITRIYNSLPLYLDGKKKNYLEEKIGLRIDAQFSSEPISKIIQSLDHRDVDCKKILKESFNGWTYGHYQRSILRKDSL